MDWINTYGRLVSRTAIIIHHCLSRRRRLNRSLSVGDGWTGRSPTRLQQQRRPTTTTVVNDSRGHSGAVV